MDIKLNKEQRQALLPYEKHLNTAYYGSYIHGMTLSDAREIYKIYNQIFNKNERSFTCSHCRLRITKLLAQLYYKTTKTNGKSKSKTTDNN